MVLGSSLRALSARPLEVHLAMELTGFHVACALPARAGAGWKLVHLEPVPHGTEG